MKKYNSEDLLNTLIEDTKNIVKTIRTEFVYIPDEMLNTKNNSEVWSVLECFQHLIIASRHYHDEINKQLQVTTTIATDQFTSGFLGNYFTNSMKPKDNGEIPSKMKTLKKFRPERSLNRDTIDQFIKEQNELISLLERAKKVNLEKVKIKSAIGGWLTFKLGDAFRFMVAHTQRHVLQAQNTLRALHEVA